MISTPKASMPIENATMHRPAGVFEDGRWHFCAACVPVELKSLLHSAKIEAAHADFLDETENSSCVAVNNYIDFDFGIRSNIAARMEDTGTTMTYTPPVCYTHQSDAELNYTDPDDDNDGANRDRRVDWTTRSWGSSKWVCSLSYRQRVPSIAGNAVHHSTSSPWLGVQPLEAPRAKDSATMLAATTTAPRHRCSNRPPLLAPPGIGSGGSFLSDVGCIIVM